VVPQELFGRELEREKTVSREERDTYREEGIKAEDL
jgi:hypothetical protein